MFQVFILHVDASLFLDLVLQHLLLHLLQQLTDGVDRLESLDLGQDGSHVGQPMHVEGLPAMLGGPLEPSFCVCVNYAGMLYLRLFGLTQSRGEFFFVSSLRIL